MSSQNSRALKRLVELGRRKGYLLSGEIEEMLPDDLPGGGEALETALSEGRIAVIRGPEAYRSQDAAEIVQGEFEEHQGQARPAPRAADRARDPMRMYLREMGATPLLDRHGELEIARSLEHGEWRIYVALATHPELLRELLVRQELNKARARAARSAAAEKDPPALDDRAENRVASCAGGSSAPARAARVTSSWSVRSTARWPRSRSRSDPSATPSVCAIG